jgi:hypothetical protein
MEHSDQEKTLSGKQEETPSPNTASELTGKLQITLPAIKLKSKADITPSREEQADFDKNWDIANVALPKIEKIKAFKDIEEELESELSTTSDPEKILLIKKALANIRKSWIRLQRELRELEGAPQIQESRSNQRHRDMVRERAKIKWAKNPQRTIASIIKDDNIIAVFKGRKKPYTTKTLRDWIKNLAPNRKKGRRPNSR